MSVLPLLALVLFARGGGGAPAQKPATQNVRGKSGRAYVVIRVPSRTKRFRVQFQARTSQFSMFWESDFDGAKPVAKSLRANADKTMLADVAAFPASVWA